MAQVSALAARPTKNLIDRDDRPPTLAYRIRGCAGQALADRIAAETVYSFGYHALAE
jgi:hypothetical protein